jgi:hypothetical protein
MPPVRTKKMKKDKKGEATFAGGSSTCSTDRQLPLLHLANKPHQSGFPHWAIAYLRRTDCNERREGLAWTS